MVLNDCVLESGLLYHRLLELVEVVLLNLLERELPRPHRLLKSGMREVNLLRGLEIGLLERSVVSANHATMGLEDQGRVNIRILSCEGGKLVSMLCELITLAAAGLTSLMLCN
jgi:hypothetical protein